MNNQLDNRDASIKAPYEDVILQGIKKLDSQILIFLLLYVIILSGMVSYFNTIPLALQLALITIPFFGVVAFIFYRRKSVSEQLASNISVRVNKIGDKARVIGGQGDQSNANINVDVENASGESMVIGVASPTMPQQSASDLETLLLSEFNKLSSDEKFDFIHRLKQR